MATIRDVARRAGVSTSTVSHVLNGTRSVSQSVRERVGIAVSELGFELNQVARTLRVNLSRTIGLIISDLSSPFFTAVVRGVEDVAQQRGYTLILCNSDEKASKELTYLKMLRSKRVDGIIVSPTAQPDAYLYKLIDGGTPLVFLDRELPDINVPCVLLDNERAAYEVVSHLIEVGHRRIGMICGSDSLSTNVRRIAGYSQALEAAEIAVDQRLIAAVSMPTGAMQAQGAAEAASELLNLDPRPTALFAANYLMTIGTLIGVQCQGLEIPSDVAVAGIDDFEWAEAFRPRITTVAQPTYELGSAAAELLFRQLDAGDVPSNDRVVLRGVLIVRESSGLGPLVRTAVQAPAGRRPPSELKSARSRGGAVPKHLARSSLE